MEVKKRGEGSGKREGEDGEQMKERGKGKGKKERGITMCEVR